jgi:hypothetical protein
MSPRVITMLSRRSAVDDDSTDAVERASQALERAKAAETEALEALRRGEAQMTAMDVVVAYEARAAQAALRQRYAAAQVERIRAERELAAAHGARNRQTFEALWPQYRAAIARLDAALDPVLAAVEEVERLYDQLPMMGLGPERAVRLPVVLPFTATTAGIAHWRAVGRREGWLA